MAGTQFFASFVLLVALTAALAQDPGRQKNERLEKHPPRKDTSPLELCIRYICHTCSYDFEVGLCITKNKRQYTAKFIALKATTVFCSRGLHG